MTPPRGRGNPQARIMFVGEAWGKQEEAEGKPFVGPAGKVLTELQLKAGINPADCYYTNLVNAKPPGNDLAAWYRHGMPSDLLLDGLTSLAEEIDLVKPNVIVPLGNWPLYAFYGQRLNRDGEPTGILDYRGYVLEARKLARGTKIIPTAHPSYILQGGYADSPLVLLDLKRARAQSQYPEIRRKPRLAIIDPQGSEREAIRHRLLSEGRYLVTDIEYIGSRLLCIGFAVSSDWATTIRIRSPADLAWCRSLIEEGRPLAAQNAMFDLGILDWHYQLDAFKYLKYDTMVAAYNLNIEYKKDLGQLAGMYTDMDAWWDKISWDRIKAGTQSIDDVWEYNCLDNMATYEILEAQIPELDSDPKIREAFEFDMRKLYPLWKMARRGVSIDLEKIRELKVRAESDEK
jgi:uracil-DNA glycosylase family 4